MSKEIDYQRADTIIESCHAITNMVNEIRLVMTELKFAPNSENLLLYHAEALKKANNFVDDALQFLGDHLNNNDMGDDKIISLTERAYDMQAGISLIPCVDLVHRIRSLRNTIAIHPQALEDSSEFSDQVITTDELLSNLEHGG